MKTQKLARARAKAVIGSQSVDVINRVQGVGSSIDDLMIAGRTWRAELGDAVLDANLERTVEGASTVTVDVHDPHGNLLRSPLLRERYDVELDDLWFTSVKVSRTDSTTLQLVFEDREVATLRGKAGARKVKPSKVTLPQFCLMLVREVKPRIPFYSPELHAPVAKLTSARAARQAAPTQQATRQPGLSASAGVTVKGERADAEQIRNIDRTLDVGRSMRIPKKGLICNVVVGTVEALCRNPSGGDRDSVGFYQQRGSQGWPASRDLERDGTAFYKAMQPILRRSPSISVAALAQAIQRSGNPGAYGQWVDEATKTVEKYLRSTGGTASKSAARGPGTSASAQQALERHKKENTWDCMGRLTDDVGWRRFCSSGIVYVLSEPDLLGSAPRVTLSDSSPGLLDVVTFDEDEGKNVTDVTLDVMLNTWQAPPGTVVELDDSLGPAAGFYIASTIRAPIRERAVQGEIQLARPQLPKPPSETVGQGKSGKRRLRKDGKGKSASTATGGDITQVHITRTGAGPPGWGGTADVFEQFIHPFMRRHGLQPGAQKETGHAPQGDHDPSQRTSYATDYPTFNGAETANKLGRVLGRNGDSVGTYATFNVRVDHRMFRVQILWGVPDHHDHIHVGLRAV